MAAIPLIGRRTEMATVDRFLDILPAGSRCLVLEGEVGIGKTTLLDQATSQALDRRYLVLSASPVESEVPLEFAGLADLLAAVPSSTLDQLPAPQRNALGTAVFRNQVSDVPVDPHTLASAVLTTFRLLAGTTPVLLAIDDLPWLDTPSARVLSFVLRRARATPLGFVATVRTEWPPGSGSLGTDLLAAVHIEHLRIGPLDVGEIRDLLATRTPHAPTRAKMARIQEISRGNPYFALELAGTQDDDQWEGEAAEVPVSLSRLVLERLRALPDGARDVVLVSALSDQPTVGVVRAASIDPTGADDDLDFAQSEGILRRHRDHLAFTHPLIRSVMAADASPKQRRSAHGRLANVVEDQERRARHRAFAATLVDEQTAREVEQAAGVAAGRGACDTAVSLARLSVGLTPPERLEELRRRTALEAEYCFVIGDIDRACDLLEGIVDDMPAGPARAELLRQLSRYLTHRGDPLATWADKLAMALDESQDDLSLRASILVDAAFVASYTDDPAAADLYVARAVAAVDEHADQALAAQFNAALARMALIRGEGLRRDLVEKALQGPDPPVRLATEMRPNVVIGHVLRLVGDLDRARDLYQKEHDRAQREGVKVGLPIILGGLVQTETVAGNWDRAERLSIEALERIEDAGSAMARSYVGAAIALLWVYQGRLEEGLEHARRSVELSGVIGMPVFMQYAAEALGLAELSRGDAAAAHRRLEPLLALRYVREFREPSLLRFIPMDIEALIELGDLDAAAELLAPFQARSIELGRASEISTSGRCRALLLAAQGDLDGAVVAVDGALTPHPGLGTPFEHGRTLLVAGVVHRRARHKGIANTHLRAALSIFERLGSPLWVEHSRAEIDRLGLRRSPSSSTLTTTERRVADLAATGLTNARIAAQLFMSPRTVEAHLSRIYRKLGVNSRTAMSRVHLAGSDLDKRGEQTAPGPAP